MRKGCGCLGVLLIAVLMLGSAAASAPELTGLVGLYSYVIGKGAITGMVGRPTFGTLVSVDLRPRDRSGDVGPAIVSYKLDGGPVRQATLRLLPRADPSGYRAGQQIPILVSRIDGSVARYDEMWSLRPEHQERLAPLWKMAIDNTRRSRSRSHD